MCRGVEVQGNRMHLWLGSWTCVGGKGWQMRLGGGRALRGGGLGPLPLGDGALQKDFLKGRESDLHFRNNILGTCIKKRREDYRNLEVNEVDQ